jgi:DNA-binding transcriptional ArsR family regulator
MRDGAPKAVLYEGFARVGRALGSPARIELLNLLAQGEQGVEELAAAAGLKVSNTCAHLKTLAAAGLVTSRRAGTRVFYRIAGPQVTALAGLPRDKEIIAYCRGRFCATSLDAVRLLRRHGYRPRPMDGGLPEWRDEGMPIAAA